VKLTSFCIPLVCNHCVNNFMTQSLDPMPPAQLSICPTVYPHAGYARRGLRSAISAAQKDGLVVEEVMQPAADTFGSGAARGAGASADAAAGTDWGKVSQEMKGVDAEWAANKAGRAREWG
jgi:hypothetical protein